MKNRKYICRILLCVLYFYSPYKVYAQNNSVATNPLHIGDQFNGFETGDLMRGIEKNLNWDAVKNKIVILDFFDTYCTVCIASMPNMQMLQNKFSKDLQIYNVAWQDRKTLTKFYHDNAFLKEKKVYLPVIYNDKYLKSLFPHESAPHVVIIYKGKVQAITFHRVVTEENIKLLLQNGHIDLPIKDDYGTVDLAKDNAKGTLGVWLSGYQNGVKVQALKIVKDSLSNNVKTSFYNRSIYRSLINAWNKIQRSNSILRNSQIIWKVRDSSIYENFTKSGEAWDVKNAISYERVDNIQYPDSVMGRLVLGDLHSFLGIKSYWTTKKQKCLLLVDCPPVKMNKTIENKMQYAGTDVFTKFMSINEQMPLIADQKKSDKILEIGSFKDIDELNMQLRQYGCVLVEGEADFEAIVIEEFK
ncbi:TlpA disulfide reductase family protein [Sphingobacterium sp. DR205]|uniref:TlpA family protein disulfide reductase n=1 Tax=Sphingobacterium sp. DR205 TaxID=2713573 RepID=UPI0013E410ED|nr:TlpA disulfide reductase family protein [Sphingobacterium sp. DR205]QIH34105.1 TlpA family protein disulfide reductase [Sphingobacterium sp. DR205]